MDTVIMVSAGRCEARAARLASGSRSPVTPTFRGEALYEVIREVFNIAPEAPKPDSKEETSGELVIIILIPDINNA